MNLDGDLLFALPCSWKKWNCSKYTANYNSSNSDLQISLVMQPATTMFF